ncbi:hypothetical protein, partial [Escherichia coli]|uniref:hypothetical protein n=1 Tax=Escherichia coli TaxID=562 RepID=UPI0027380914
ADRNRSHWSTSKTPSYTKSVSWQHHRVELTSATIINFFVFIKLPFLQTTVFLLPVIIILPTSPKSISR